MQPKILLLQALAITFVGIGVILTNFHCHIIDKRLNELEKRATICEEKIRSMNA